MWGKLDLFRYLGSQNNAATQALSFNFFFGNSLFCLNTVQIMFTQTATLRTCSRSMLYDVSHRLIVTYGNSDVTQ